MKKLTALLLALCLIFALAACAAKTETQGQSTTTNPETSTSAPATEQNTQPSAQENTGTQTAAPVSSKDTLTVVLDQEIVTVDPADQAQRATSQFLFQIYERLMTYGEGGTHNYQLATSVEQEDDVTYVVKLREGVKFHNGEELKSSDVVFSYKRAIEIGKGTTLSVIDPEGFEIVDDYTLKIRTKEPVATFYTAICSSQSCIVSEKAVTELGEKFGTDATGAGTGPFMFDEWVVGQQFSCVKFADYWGTPAILEKQVWKFVSDANSRNVMLQAGEADVIYQVQAAGIEALLDDPNVTVYSQPSTTIRFLYLNQKDGMPLSNKALRQAIAYAIDRKALVQNVFGDYATPATSFLAPAILGHTDDLETYEYNPEMAKQKLIEAGYPDGIELGIYMHSQNVLIRMAEVIQAYCAEVGITLSINPLDTNAWIAALSDATTDFGFNANSNTNCDPVSLDTPCYSANCPAPNHSQIQDPVLDQMLDEGRSEFDEAARAAIYVKAQQYIADECYLYPICYDNVTVATAANLKGYEFSNLSADRFDTCWFE